MAKVRRKVALVLLAAACETSEEVTELDSRCKAFTAPDPPHYETEPFANVAGVKRIIAATKTYGLDAAGKLYVLDTDASPLAADLGSDVRAIAASADATRLYVLSGVAPVQVVRLTSADGLSFDPSSASPVIEVAKTGVEASGGALTIDRDGVLLVATPGGTDTSRAQDDTSRLGKVLRISNPDSANASVEVFARGFRGPTGIDVDPETGEVWVSDRTAMGDEIDRVFRGKSYGWPILDGLLCATPEECSRSGHVPPVAVREGSSNLVVHRGAVAPLVGKVIVADDDLRALAPFGPSGTTSITKLGPIAKTVGRGSHGELLIATADAVLRVKDVASTAPKTLAETGCFDLASPEGVPIGAIPYDVASPAWSDGADKSRFVVIPKGARARSLPDGDIRFPVGTVAVKTFRVDGKKVETRLLVQHALESWVGYSYAWGDDGETASLVVGNKVKLLADGKSWYFPSSDDCMACHTPAAGYTLGIEARQISDASLDTKLLSPIDHGHFPALASPKTPNASAEARARGYLHANCSMCHRDGSSTGVAELDLRVDVPLERSGLCDPPKAGDFGIADGRMIAASDPARSVLLHRMRALDDARMPKLASHVVDEAGAAAIEQWIMELRSCP